MADSVKKEDSPFKIYLYAILMSTLILVLVVLRNIWTLGAPMMAAEYFPSYTTARIIGVGDFLTGSRAHLHEFYLVGSRNSLVPYRRRKGHRRLFGLKTGGSGPRGFPYFGLCAIVYENIMQMFDFLRFYQYYAIPFQFVIPLIVWITAEIKSKNKLKPLC
jgi:spore germination protein KB